MDGILLQLLVAFAWITCCMGGNKCYWQSDLFEDHSCDDWDYFIGTGNDPSNVFSETSNRCCPKADGGEDVVLCEHANFEGTCMVSNIADGKHCANVEKKNWASSVHTLGKCIRLYDDENCLGKSRSYFAGDNRPHNNLAAEDMNDVVKSVGPCLDHDPNVGCCERTSVNQLKRRSSKDSMALTNLIIMGYIAGRSLRQTQYSDWNNPIQYVQRGPQGLNARTETLEAIIRPHHLGQGSTPNQVARNWVAANGWKAGSEVGNRDDAGHIVSNRLGGSGTDLNNIFPQNLYANVRYYNRVERPIYNYVHSTGRAVRLTVNLEYVGASNRPFRLLYHAVDNLSGDSLFTNVEIFNPKRRVDYYAHDDPE